ncbi:uncharacterized protein CIMG_13197 [Coccidioides immitis RS]|uniref:Uncharacterized protein n=1 Tax=Coccidioides immitis (strain RS) TaxID=246410 RepID=A0A0D8JWV4_COCIM|nr:uncharacterized protein CIMG_13197 [Coccidioides immitis RS]KJF60758.1 hypothetical protein CIMG_13197 [Coccidioides immitis RS]
MWLLVAVEVLVVVDRGGEGQLQLLNSYLAARTKQRSEGKQKETKTAEESSRVVWVPGGAERPQVEKGIQHERKDLRGRPELGLKDWGWIAHLAGNGELFARAVLGECLRSRSHRNSQTGLTPSCPRSGSHDWCPGNGNIPAAAASEGRGSPP